MNPPAADSDGDRRRVLGTFSESTIHDVLYGPRREEWRTVRDDGRTPLGIRQFLTLDRPPMPEVLWVRGEETISAYRRGWLFTRSSARVDEPDGPGGDHTSRRLVVESLADLLAADLSDAQETGETSTLQVRFTRRWVERRRGLLRRREPAAIALNGSHMLALRVGFAENQVSASLSPAAASAAAHLAPGGEPTDVDPDAVPALVDAFLDAFWNAVLP